MAPRLDGLELLAEGVGRRGRVAFHRQPVDLVEQRVLILFLHRLDQRRGAAASGCSP